MLGSRAIYHDGWKAVAYHPVGPIYDDGLSANAPFGDDVWELYHVAEDVSEAHDLAAEHPEKVAELVALWWDEARRNDVLPLDNRVLEAMAHKNDRRRPTRHVPLFPGRGSGARVGGSDVRNRSHTVTVTVDVADGGGPERHPARARVCPRRVVAARPRRPLRYVHNLHGQRLYEVVADSPLAAGRHVVEFRFDKDRGAGGQGTLWFDGDNVGTGSVDRFTPVAFNEVGIGLTCGYEWGPSVGGDYEAPFRFNGTIVRAEVTATGPVVRDPVAEVAAILSSQ